MIDFTKYEGHTETWASICMYGANGTWGYFPICAGDRHLLADAPIIIEALKAAQARIVELENANAELHEVNFQLGKEKALPIKCLTCGLQCPNDCPMDRTSKPSEYTDDELLDMSR